MSKIINYLNQTLDIRQNRDSSALNNNRSENAGDQEDTSAESQRAFFSLDIQFMLTIAVVMLSLWTSYRAMIKVSDESMKVQYYTDLVLAKAEELESLNHVAKEVQHTQTNYFSEIEHRIKQHEKLVHRNFKELSELTLDSNIIRVELDTIKSTQQELMNGYIDLSNRWLKESKIPSSGDAGLRDDQTLETKPVEFQKFIY